MQGPDNDILIVGAGISGISMAAHLQMMCPDRTFSIVERRANIGGTWDLFRYPGIRSDSDMHSFGFAFEPWRDDKAIADGDAILSYLQRIVSERQIDQHITFDTTVVSANWNSEEAMWHVTLEDDAGWRTVTARFLYLGSGYYDYDNPHDAQIPGLENFAGTSVHPQFWPSDLDWSGKRVVIIGSGATAVTIVPVMAEDAAHVTMLQRTPTWMAAGPSRDKWARRFRKVLPEKWAYGLTRLINTRLHQFVIKRAREKPERVSAFLTRKIKEQLGDHYRKEDFQPPYRPWEQRLCLVPDGDLFDAITSGKASVKTAEIAAVEADGIRLQDGETLAADLIITATGLRLTLGGKIDITLDGEPIAWSDQWFYRNCMFADVPNLAIVFGYLSASWTLRADLTAKYVCRVLNQMAKNGADTVVPRPEDVTALTQGPGFPFSSGYIQRALPLMPKSEAKLPWRLNMDYFEDKADYAQRPINDGLLQFLDSSKRSVASEDELP